MDTKKLKYFIAVAEDMSFSKAARRLGISQSSLSRAVSHLEASLCTKLFFRSSNAIELTSSGAAFLRKAIVAIELLEEASVELRRHSNRREFSFDIGYIPSCLDSFLGNSLSLFIENADSLSIHPHEMSPGEQISSLRQGKIDIAFLGHGCPELEYEFDLFKIYEIPLSIVVSSKSKFATAAKIEIDNLNRMELVGLQSNAFPDRQRIVSTACERIGLEKEPTIMANTLQSALAIVASKEAFAIMPIEVKSIASSLVSFIIPEQNIGSIDFTAAVKRGEKRRSILKFLRSCRYAALGIGDDLT